ncbi:MAG TPA: hypothetical protein PLC89_29335, partial [Haliscomenobacter sp.]|uniref:hypothetical protein n=1 Tax=Haliscomenobacter sp. TaxID=2717303 RepID=UPI002C355ECE
MLNQIRLILVSLVLLITLFLKAQQPDTLEASRLLQESKTIYYSGTADFKLAFVKAKQAKNIFLAALGPKQQRVADAWYWMGTYANYLPNEHSRDYFFTAYLIYRDLWGEDHEDAILAKANYGTLFAYTGDYERCIKILKECERSCERSSTVIATTKGFVYVTLGQVAQERDEVEYYTKKGIQLYASVDEPWAWANVGVCYNTLGMMYLEDGDYEMARQYEKKALWSVFTHQSPEHPNAAVYLSILANIFFELQQMDSTLVYCKRAEQVLHKNYDTPHPTLINIKTLEGEVWAQRGQKGKALQAWAAALQVAHAPGNENFSVHYNNLCLARAKFHLQYKQYSEATTWCDSVTFNSRFHSPKTLDQALDQGGVIKALSLYNQILASQFDPTNDPKTLRAFNRALSRMLECVKVLKTFSLGRPFDPVTLNEALLPSIEAALDVEQRKSQSPTTRLSQQFFYLQLAKAEVLTNAFQANRLTQIAGIPETLLQREKDGKKKLADLKSKVAQAEAAKDSKTLQKLYAEQFDEKKRFDHLQAQLQKQYPKLAALRGSTPVPNLNDVR